jgi:RNA polymerase sigma factor (sigma-70 family)
MNNNQNINFDLVLAHLEFAQILAKKYSKFGINYYDLYSESVLGLIVASKTFDSSKSSFKTYSAKFIKNRILIYYSKNKYQIAIPIEKFRELVSLKKKSDDISQNSIFYSYFYNQFYSKDSDELKIDFAEDIQESIIKNNKTKELESNLKQYFKYLSEKDKYIISNYLGINTGKKSLPQIAKDLKLSIKTVEQLKTLIVKKLKQQINKMNMQNISYEQLRERFLKCQS